MESTTPEGSPAPSFIPLGENQQQQQQPFQQQQQPSTSTSAPDTSSILKALADMAKQNTAAPATSGVPAQTSPNSILGAQATVPPVATSSVDQAPQQTNGQAVNPFAGGNLAAQFPGFSNPTPNPSALFPNQTQPPPPNPLSAPQNPLAALLPQAQAQAQAPPPAAGLPPDTMQQLSMLQLLAAQGIPQDQWATALQILNLTNAANSGMGNMNPAALAAAFAGQQPQNPWGAPGPDLSSRDRDRDRERERDHDYMRSPPGGYRRRSRSPGYDRRRDLSPGPRRRDSPVYGDYHSDSPGRGRGRPRNDYRQRSPPGGRRRRSPSPRKEASLPPPGPKYVEYDYSIGQGNIKGEFIRFYKSNISRDVRQI